MLSRYKSNIDKTTVRSPLPGDYGWIVQVHGQYYAEKFGWYEDFECIVAKIMVEYLDSLKSNRQACYIAEQNGLPVGCIMLMEDSQDLGKVRVLFVSDSARRQGIGWLLINALLEKAQEIGYRKLSLWTTNNQIEARELYRKAGFSLVSESPNTTFAKGSVDEKWEKAL
ncbi:MAG: GNAT family N-acetyltransferase [Desulforhopalus sp.]|nr:GNAT family N-acetyltransferase [Desulforhopalus sp.]